MKIFKGNIVFTPSPTTLETLENGCIVVDDHGKIEGIYASDCQQDRYAVLPEHYTGCETVDYGDRLLMPAMCDLHVHAPQYRNQGMAMDLELLPWLQHYTFPEEMRYADQKYASVMYKHFVRDMLRQGTTRAAVFATVHPEATKLLAQEFHVAGMGAKIGLVGMDRDCPEALSNTPDSVVDSTLQIVETTRSYPLVDAIVTPRFVPTCTSEMLRRLGKLAVEESLPVQSHLSENKGEIALVKRLEPGSSCYGGVYNKYSLFGQTPTLMAHCCYTDGEELDMMKRCAFDGKRGVMVVHCPTSNCNVASGVAPVRRFMEEGIPVALGSDISGGHHLSMFRVMQYAQQMSKLIYAQTNGETPFLCLSEVFYLATKAGGSFFGKVGSFESGYSFDALVVNDTALNAANREAGGKEYTLAQRLERFVYLGDDRMIEQRFCEGKRLAPTPPCMEGSNYSITLTSSEPNDFIMHNA